MSSAEVASAPRVPVQQFPLIHVHGLFVAISSVLGWWLTVHADADGPQRFFGFLLMFLASTLFPALLVKAYVTRRPTVVTHVIPVLAMLAWAFARFLGIVTS